jgi:hypothetical protein
MDSLAVLVLQRDRHILARAAGRIGFDINLRQRHHSLDDGLSQIQTRR